MRQMSSNAAVASGWNALGSLLLSALDTQDHGYRTELRNSAQLTECRVPRQTAVQVRQVSGRDRAWNDGGKMKTRRLWSGPHLRVLQAAAQDCRLPQQALCVETAAFALHVLRFPLRLPALPPFRLRPTLTGGRGKGRKGNECTNWQTPPPARTIGVCTCDSGPFSGERASWNSCGNGALLGRY